MLPADTDMSPAAHVTAPHAGTLDDWLDWQMQLHSSRIVLGLDRVRTVAQCLGVLPLDTRCVVVAGTNGKGSCVRLIEALLQARGQRVGAYTSPHLWRYNERVRIAGEQVDDSALCAAFAAVEAARGEVALTFFEFGTLAALWLFQRAELDFAVLEIGLGGRLDAVNIIDAEVALITNIGLDHAAFLGTTRAQIGTEKAGVMRTGQPVVCADPALPQTVSDHADAVAARLYRLDQDYALDDQGWCDWAGQRLACPAPLPAHVRRQNLAAALAVVVLLEQPPQSGQQVAAACAAQKTLHGRCEIVEDGAVPIIYDVAHNAQAMALLVDYLRTHPVAGATHVVLGMLADKPVETVARMLAPLTDVFYAADLSAVSPRGVDAPALAQRMGHAARPAATPAAALAMAQAAAQAGDRIVVCGSFFTVAHARKEPE